MPLQPIVPNVAGKYDALANIVQGVGNAVGQIAGGYKDIYEKTKKQKDYVLQLHNSVKEDFSNPEVLSQLGWTPQQGQDFINKTAPTEAEIADKELYEKRLAPAIQNYSHFIDNGGSAKLGVVRPNQLFTSDKVFAASFANRKAEKTQAAIEGASMGGYDFSKTKGKSLEDTMAAIGSAGSVVGGMANRVPVKTQEELMAKVPGDISAEDVKASPKFQSLPKAVTPDEAANTAYKQANTDEANARVGLLKAQSEYYGAKADGSIGATGSPKEETRDMKYLKILEDKRKSLEAEMDRSLKIATDYNLDDKASKEAYKRYEKARKDAADLDSRISGLNLEIEKGMGLESPVSTEIEKSVISSQAKQIAKDIRKQIPPVDSENLKGGGATTTETTRDAEINFAYQHAKKSGFDIDFQGIQTAFEQGYTLEDIIQLIIDAGNNGGTPAAPEAPGVPVKRTPVAMGRPLPASMN